MHDRPALALAAIVGAFSLSTQDVVQLTVRQQDRYSSPADVPSSSVSADGRFVAFASFARLVPADTNTHRDIYVLDRSTGSVSIESLGDGADAADQDSMWPRIADDGRRLVYETLQAQADGRVIRVIALRDRRLATTRIVQRGSEPPNGSSREPAISGDGRIVVFSSCATNLADGFDANGHGEDVYAFDVAANRFERTSVRVDGLQPATGASFAASVSRDGRYVAFTSTSDLEPPFEAPRRAMPTRNTVYVRDRDAHVTTRVSVGRDGAAANGTSFGGAISGDGAYVAFVSDASNLVAHDANGLEDVFLYDMRSRRTVLLSRGLSGGSANGLSRNPAIDAHGVHVAFLSEASNLTCADRCPGGSRDLNLLSDVVLYNRAAGAVRRLSTGRHAWLDPSGGAAINGTGDVVAFSSRHPIDADDTNNDFDLFIWISEAVEHPGQPLR